MKIQIETVHYCGYEELLNMYPVLEEFNPTKAKLKNWSRDIIHIEIKTLEELKDLATMLDKSIIFHPSDGLYKTALHKTTEPYLEIYDDYRE